MMTKNLFYKLQVLINIILTKHAILQIWYTLELHRALIFFFKYFHIAVTSTLIVLKVKCTFVIHTWSYLWHISLRIRNTISPWIILSSEEAHEARKEQICNLDLNITIFCIIYPCYIIYLNRNILYTCITN